MVANLHVWVCVCVCVGDKISDISIFPHVKLLYSVVQLCKIYHFLFCTFRLISSLMENAHNFIANFIFP